MMTKDPAQRPSSGDLLAMPYVRDRMTNFLQNAEMDQMLENAIYKKQRPTIHRKNTARGDDLNF